MKSNSNDELGIDDAINHKSKYTLKIKRKHKNTRPTWTWSVTMFAGFNDVI
jgi:hypothetical protein